MSSYELAIEAKRAGNFDLALKYHQQEMKEKGISPHLLFEIAKIFYLKKEGDWAVAYNIAATHLQLHLYEQELEQGNPSITSAIKKVSENIVKQFPRPIGVLLIYEKEMIRHISHILMDQELVFEKAPDLRPYAQIYYAEILDDGSAPRVMEQFNITREEAMNMDEERYNSHGFRVLMSEIKWDQLENTDVWSLYINANNEK